MAREAAPRKDQDRADQPLGRDERVSFYPMEAEAVLRKLLRAAPVKPRQGQEHAAGRRLTYSAGACTTRRSWLAIGQLRDLLHFWRCLLVLPSIRLDAQASSLHRDYPL